MKKIEASVFSHLSIIEQMQGFKVNPSYVTGICASAPLEVHRFEELVEHIAKISYYNYPHCLFYRGQSKDYLSGDATTLFPKIYRNIVNSSVLMNRFKSLEIASLKLLNVLQSHHAQSKILGLKKLLKFREIAWAILQHYEICPTPVLDVTSSLRVAATFSLINDGKTPGDDGILYVLGLPHINENISYHVDDELFNIKLLSVCPPAAKRPYYQEGFGVGTFPHYDLTSKKPKFDFKNRLIAKFKLINTDNNFFGRGFDMIPYYALYPNNHDAFYEMLQPLRDDPELKCLL